MKKTIAIIGHVDHGKTTLTDAINDVLKNAQKTINKIIEEEKSIKITNPHEPISIIERQVRESRRERRARERKSKSNK